MILAVCGRCGDSQVCSTPIQDEHIKSLEGKLLSERHERDANALNSLVEENSRLRGVLEAVHAIVVRDDGVKYDAVVMIAEALKATRQVSADSPDGDSEGRTEQRAGAMQVGHPGGDDSRPAATSTTAQGPNTEAHGRNCVYDGAVWCCVPPCPCLKHTVQDTDGYRCQRCFTTWRAGVNDEHCPRCQSEDRRKLTAQEPQLCFDHGTDLDPKVSETCPMCKAGEGVAK